MPDDNDTPADDVPAHHRLAPPAPPHLIVQHLQSLATPAPAARIYEEDVEESGPELRTYQARRKRRRDLLIEAGVIADDTRIGDEAPVPRLIQPDGLPTRAPSAPDPFTTDPFFQPKDS